MKYLFLLLPVVLLAVPLTGCSEEDDPHPTPPATWESWYGACRVTAVKADYATGRIWAGTERNGFRYYNGSSWVHLLRENSSLLSNEVQDVCLDSQGYCWIASNGGISIFDGSGIAGHHSAALSGGVLPSDDIRCLYLDSQGRMWAGTPLGAAYYTGTTWQGGFNQTGGLAEDDVTCISEDSQATPRIWFGHSGSGITQWDGSTYAIITTTEGLTGNDIRGIDFDSGGTAWVATNGGVTSIAGSTYTPYTASGSLPQNNVRAIAVDPADVVWMATNSQGVASLSGVSWNTYTYAGGHLSTDGTRAIHASSSSAVWVGTDAGLNWQYPTTGWTGDFAGNKPISSNRIHRIFEDSAGRIWIPTEYGLIRNDHEAWSVWSGDTHAMEGNFCNVVFVDEADVTWIGMGSLIPAYGLNRFDGTGWATYTTTEGLAANVVTDIDQDSGGDLWISTSNGVSRFDRNTSTPGFTTYRVADGLGSNLVNCATVSSLGAVWVGTWGGVSLFDGTSSWTTFNTSDGLPNNVVTDIAFQGTNVWVSTWGGVAVSADGGSSWTTYTAGGGNLPSDTVTGIAVGPSGDVYAATNAGLAMRVGTTWSTWSQANSGLVQNSLNSVSLSADGKTVYMGTQASGVSIYRPEHLQTTGE